MLDKKSTTQKLKANTAKKLRWNATPEECFLFFFIYNRAVDINNTS
jgi:hypothetical protein